MDAFVQETLELNGTQFMELCLKSYELVKDIFEVNEIDRKELFFDKGFKGL